MHVASLEFGNTDKLATFFPIDETEAAVATSYPIDPSRQVLAIVRHQGRNNLRRLHWGLVPYWAKDKRMGRRLINARAESVATKPSFRNAFEHRRCLIPAIGFYEWQSEKSKQQPVYFTLPDSRPFAFAGIWERWDNRTNAGAIYLSCAIITTVASRSVASVHHRMPVILKTDVYRTWLDPGYRDVRELEAVLRRDIIGELIHQPASRQVGLTAKDNRNGIRPMAQMHLDFK